jgi:hypothetical protein
MITARMRSGVLVALLLLAATAACTNSEELNSGVSSVPVEVTIVNPDTRFDRAFFDVTQVAVRPVDPQAAEVLGTNPLWIMKTTEGSAIEINLNGVEGGYMAPSQLTEGLYEVESIELRTLEFGRGERIGDATCAEYITDYFVVNSIQLAQFDERVVLQVVPGATSPLKIQIDGQALATAFENSWQCAQGAPGCGFVNPPPWCLFPAGAAAFNPSTFAQQAPTFISFD